MSNPFFERPILNSPYEHPARHWKLDDSGQPTGEIAQTRRPAQFITPIPAAKKRGSSRQGELDIGAEGLSDHHLAIINGVRAEVDKWRQLPPEQWHVTPETARLLQYWRHYEFQGIRPFFCQTEAVETAIWLTEVAPNIVGGRRYIDYLKNASDEANPGLPRLALKLATGAGKTTVMAMLIAWQTINAVRNPENKRFTRGFLIVAPGITIRDRLRVLLPSDPESYYTTRELLPADMRADIQRAHIVITNYHAFRRRELLDISKGARALLQGRHSEPVNSEESEGQMLQRVMPELLRLERVIVINDEAHHCYREKPGSAPGDALKGDDKKEAEANNAAARLWISGLEALGRSKVKLSRVFDLSATPFFLRGSGYAEGALFPWTMSDFSLMDAIECGIVKLPRVPVSQNIPGSSGEKITTAEEALVFRNLWEHIKKDMPKKGRGKSGDLNPQLLPAKLKTALNALYGHYEKVFSEWEKAGLDTPPCFIVVCNNTSTSKLVADYIAGYEHENPDGTHTFQQGALPLFCNYNSDDGEPLARPRTILIDSQQLESGGALDASFKTIAAAEIEQFRRDIATRSGEAAAQDINDADLLREVMNTVGKPGRLGAGVRCVVSVSMLTEGWDANTVTHILGVRAFGTQLLCEQVTGRALRRLSYTRGEDGLMPAEYADILGIPFSFAAEPVVTPPRPPRKLTHIHALPGRNALEIRFPRVLGWNAETPPSQQLAAHFTEDSRFEFTPELIGPTKTENAGIVGETTILTPQPRADGRTSDFTTSLTDRLLHTPAWQGEGGQFDARLFTQLKRIVRQWVEGGYLICKGDIKREQLFGYPELIAAVCEKINHAILRGASAESGAPSIRAILDPYNPTGSTAHVNFRTSKDVWKTERSHINHAVLDSDWEGEFCRILDQHPRVLAWVKNQGLGFEIPYIFKAEPHRYIPDFIVLADDGHGADDPLHLIVEVKGYRGENAKAKKETTETHWLPAINSLSACGRWAFAELRDVWEMESDLAAALRQAVDNMLQRAGSAPH